MGVHGLIPFLRKACPEAIKPLANRFRDISGKRVVIDGTLVTQKLHFAPNPHHYRHVLGWYRLCEELAASQVSAVCVFDGTKRHAAKAREAQRRRAGQKQTADRGQVEQERLKRLDIVKQFVDGLPAMSQDQSPDISEALAALKMSDNDSLKTAYDTLSAQASLDALKEVSQREKDRALPTSPRPRADTEAKVSVSLKFAFDNFRTSITNLAKSVEPEPFPPPQEATAQTGLEPDLVLTKAQNQLSVMEQEFWSKLLALKPDALDGTSTYQELVVLSDTLYEQSAKMSSSFDRRSNLPTSDTYSQSKEILRAMGVLVIDAPGEIEGEALASSIVLSGKADYVISEDTDVLVYGAPLLRGLSASDPLEFVCAETIQRSLGLDYRSYLDFILLLGTDFSQRIKNVGPHRALQFIKEYGTIERILASEPKYVPKPSLAEYLDEIDTARALFSRPPPSPYLPSLEDRPGRDDLAVTEVLTRYELGWYAMKSEHYLPESLLGDSFFNDNPYAA